MPKRLVKPKGAARIIPHQAYDAALIERKGLLAYDYGKLVSITRRLYKLSQSDASEWVSYNMLCSPYIKIHPIKS